MCKMINNYGVNPLFLYFISFIFLFVATGFDTSNIVGMAGFAIITMIPTAVVLGLIDSACTTLDL